MKYKVIISKKAISDYDLARHNYKLVDIDLENRFKAEVKKIITRLKDNPELYSKIEKNQRRAVLGSSFPYNLHYVVDLDSKLVKIIGIFHGRQLPEKVREEMRLEQLQDIRDKKKELYLDRLKSLEKTRESLEQSRDHDLGLEL